MLALEAIQEQIDGDEAGEDLEEIQLDNIEFEKFTPELNKKLGKFISFLVNFVLSVYLSFMCLKPS